ncbi:type IV conjugative transfer system coupling protein TraD [Serratia marcescens]|uniref:type IV conjugative transfer system coupling protein TraD n=1 Tax=Serratia marcescens TaxID=615 RepID=UPI0003E01AD7|nr:type IV conjugative transfer system coupling protein TraD [Serratia marcescens]BAO37031.1 conjugal transfer coupling protein TraD [Serratia marcescens SM39]HBQ7493279.1 type IV conjugative transfer system coupling protein TraD [Klebsiella pneumoniae]HCR2979548.1 type IV conjugative transfer system coupling protein TraD [Serratia marcescens]
MSLNTRNVTQGGQVLKYMISMFMQINNIIVYWILMASVGIFFIWFFIRMSVEQILHGFSFWILYVFVSALPSAAKNEYTFHWTSPRTGESIELHRTAGQVLADPYFQAVGIKLKDVAFTGWGLSSIVFVSGIIAVYWYLGRKGAAQRTNEQIGGRELTTEVKDVNKILKSQNKLSNLKINDLHLVKETEMQNVALHGTVGSGKSRVVIEFLMQLRARGDRVIIYDKGNNFVPLFYRQDKDKLLNPLDKRCPAWSLRDECQTTSDFENFASTLIPDTGHGDPFWLMSARQLFVATTRRLARSKDWSIANLLKMLLSITLADLREFLKGTDAANLVDGSIEKTAMTIRSVLTSYVRSLRFLQGLDDEGKTPFNIRDWVATEDIGGDNSWIFLTSDGRNHEALKPLLTAWIYLAMVNILGLTENRERRIWLFLDELPSLHCLPILPGFVAEARKFGGCTLIGIQNFPQLREQFGKDFADAIWDLLNTKFFFRAPSSTVAEWVAKELGEMRHMKFRDQYSYGVDTIRDGVSFSKDEVRELLVSYSDVQKLNDLQCYVTLPGDYPVVKMDIKYKAMRQVAEGRIDRNVEEIFDPEIEQSIAQAEAEANGQLDAMLDRLFTPPSTLPSNANATSSDEGSPSTVPNNETAPVTENDGRTAQIQPGPVVAAPAEIHSEPVKPAAPELPERTDDNRNLRHRDIDVESDFGVER